MASHTRLVLIDLALGSDFEQELLKVGLGERLFEFGRVALLLECEQRRRRNAQNRLGLLVEAVEPLRTARVADQ